MAWQRGNIAYSSELLPDWRDAVGRSLRKHNKQTDVPSTPPGLEGNWPHPGNEQGEACLSPISNPPPLAMTNVASMKHSSSSSAPLSRSSLATSVSTRRKTSSRHQV